MPELFCAHCNEAGKRLTGIFFAEPNAHEKEKYFEALKGLKSASEYLIRKCETNMTRKPDMKKLIITTRYICSNNHYLFEESEKNYI